MIIPFSFFASQSPTGPPPLTGSYSYDATTLLSWPSSTAGYTLYTGGFVGFDDGYTTSPILSLSNFTMNNQVATNQIYVSTNGYITFGVGGADPVYSPTILGSGGATISGNAGDLYLQPGRINNDGDVQDIYYQSGSLGDNKYYINFIVYCGSFSSRSTPRSYLLNLYIDNNYQWVETRIKINSDGGTTGPYNAISVAQPASTSSGVWVGDLIGQNWNYLGTGRVIP